MYKERNCPSDVLREFVHDLKSAYGTGDGEDLGREKLAGAWPDLLVTYDRAVACLEAEHGSAESRPPDALCDLHRWQQVHAKRPVPICHGASWSAPEVRKPGPPTTALLQRRRPLRPPGDH